MKDLLRRLPAIVVFAIVFTGCKRRGQQIITLRNLSSENICFLISEKTILSDPNEIAKVRPMVVEDKEVANDIRDYSHRYQIERDSLGIIMTSESAELFVNIVPIQSIINDRYNGRLNIFIINENRLFAHSDEDIIDEKLYKHFKTVTAEQVIGDTLALEYR